MRAHAAADWPGATPFAAALHSAARADIDYPMRAILFEQFGEPADVLRLQEVPDPIPGPGQVRVKMLACPINPSDLMVVRGNYGKLPALPATPGFEGVGVVELAGPGMLGRFLVGRRVAAINSQTGSWAEKALLSARQAIPLSSRLSVEQAATFFVNPATAYVMTRKVLRVPTGEWLLQTAAGSAVGRMIIRLGQRFGFRTVNVVRRREQVDELKALGADAVVAESEGDLPRQILRATAGRGVGFAVDAVGGQTGSAAIKCLAPNGRMLLYGTLSGEPLRYSPRDLMVAGAAVEGFWLGNYMARLRLPARLHLVHTLSKLILQGVLASEIGKTFALEQFGLAVAAAEQPARGGKILLAIGS